MSWLSPEKLTAEEKEVIQEFNFTPIGSTKEQQIKAWKELIWKPEEEKLNDFVFRFSQLTHELAYSDEQQISHFVLFMPRDITLCVVYIKRTVLILRRCTNSSRCSGKS